MDTTPTGMTFQLHVDDIVQGRLFYSALFGREPDFVPHDDFVEWRVQEGSEAWIQVVEVETVSPIPTRIRFGVADLEATRVRLGRELGVETSAITTLPGVVRFCDFHDPWGNRLGLYSEIAGGDEAPSPGGSVHDSTLFTGEAEHPSPTE